MLCRAEQSRAEHPNASERRAKRSFRLMLFFLECIVRYGRSGLAKGPAMRDCMESWHRTGCSCSGFDVDTSP